VNKGTPDEMVLEPNGNAHRLVFKFKAATNIEPGGGHMQQDVFIIDNPSHHTEEWPYLDKGQEQTGKFEFKRKQ